MNAAGRELNQDQHREPRQTARRPDLNGEEVGSGEDIPVGGEKLPPGRAFPAFGRGFPAVCLEHVGDGASCDLVAEVVQGAPDPRVSPVAILRGHPDDQPPEFLHEGWAARPATAAAVVLPCDQLSMPAEKGIGRDTRLEVTQHPPSEVLPSSSVVTPRPACT